MLEDSNWHPYQISVSRVGGFWHWVMRNVFGVGNYTGFVTLHPAWASGYPDPTAEDASTPVLGHVQCMAGVGTFTLGPVP